VPLNIKDPEAHKLANALRQETDKTNDMPANGSTTRTPGAGAAAAQAGGDGRRAARNWSPVCDHATLLMTIAGYRN